MEGRLVDSTGRTRLSSSLEVHLVLGGCSQILSPPETVLLRFSTFSLFRQNTVSNTWAMGAVEAYEVTENIHYYECDISDWKQVEQAARKVKEEVSPPYSLLAYL
jgi:hypothetical protein